LLGGCHNGFITDAGGMRASYKLSSGTKDQLFDSTMMELHIESVTAML